MEGKFYIYISSAYILRANLILSLHKKFFLANLSCLQNLTFRISSKHHFQL